MGANGMRRRPAAGAEGAAPAGPRRGVGGEGEAGHVATTDGRDPSGAGAEWAMSADPADDWILDPDTGEYRMRRPGERPAPLPAAPSSPGAEIELRPARSTELVRTADPRPAGRAAARAAERGTRRGGRRRGGGRPPAGGKGGGGLALVVVLAIVGVAGCGVGGYLLLSGSGRPAPCRAAAPPSAPATTASAPADGGPATSAGPSAAPLQVRVSIYDGSGRFGLAEQVLTWMQVKQGYTRTTNKGLGKASVATSLQYEPAKADQARTLAAAMRLPARDLHATLKGDGYYDAMVLTLGKDFTAPGTAPRPPSAPAPAATAASSTCAAAS